MLIAVFSKCHRPFFYPVTIISCGNKLLKNVKTMGNNKIDIRNRVSLEVTNNHTVGVNVYDEESGRTGAYSLQHTNHSLIRSEERGINNMMITLVIEYGKLFQKQGLEFYVMGEKKLPNGIDHNLQGKVKNTVVVIGENGQIVTCYKGRAVLKHIQRKQKYLSVA
jgi:hypothetical protein